jgi:putative hydrolase of the HAD superfamily
MTRIAAVVFDYGNVLSLPPEADDFRRLQSLTGLGEEPFNRVYWLHREEYDRGALDGSGYWGRVGEAGRKCFSAAHIEALIAEDIALWNRVNPVVLGWVKALRENGLKTGVLSNMPFNLSSHLRRSADWVHYFHYLLFSCELGLIKPDAAIYHACLKGMGVKPEESLFIDDRPVNVEGARAAGMRALVFRSADQLARDIQPFGLPGGMGPSPIR